MAPRPLDVELVGAAEVPAVSARFDGVRLLVRVDGRPVGTLKLPNRPAALRPEAVRQAAVAAHGRHVWAELASRQWLPEAEAAPPEPISVVVCTRGRPERLAGCLAALATQRHPRHEVIVVDNAPVDGATREVAERFGVRYVVEPRPGLDWARNRGLAAAQFPLVAYTDDDARPDPGWASALADGFSAPEVGCVTGLVAPAELDTPAQRRFEDAYGGMGKGYDPRIFSRKSGPDRYRPEAYGVGCNMAFRRGLLDELGGFDPALDTGTASGGGGDLDAFQRVIEAGAAIVYRPDAVVRHEHRRTEPELARQIYDNGRGYCAVLCAALGRARGKARRRVVKAWLRWMVRWHLARIVRRVLRRGERMPLRLLLAELRGALAGPVLYRKARRRARALAGEGA